MKLHLQNTSERFWSKVKKTRGCWEWQAGKDANGYGQFYFCGKNFRAHRYAWSICLGRIPKGKLVLHKCNNTSCVRPSHLYLGTSKDNKFDAIQNGTVTGENSSRAKLTWKKVRSMRKLHSKGITQNELAKRFGVVEGNVWSIVNNKNWKE